jgi:hypothetical protein
MAEITAMLPSLLTEAWGHYADDKKLTVDEAISLVSSILNKMSDAADDGDVSDFFAAQSAAANSLIPFFEVDEEPPVE